MGQILGENDADSKVSSLTASNTFSRRLQARNDEVWPDVYRALPTSRMKAIGHHMGISDARQLVTVRHMLVGIFLDQLRAMAGDPVRSNVKERRKKLQSISDLAMSLRDEYEAALPDIMRDHHEADWHTSVQWGPSDHLYDYQHLLSGADVILRICDDILRSPGFNRQSSKEFGPTGLPAKLPEHYGSWAKTAFAFRLANLFVTATSRMPTVSNSQDSSFQKFAAECIDIFTREYGDLSKPFGEFAPPSRRQLREACARHK